MNTPLSWNTPTHTHSIIRGLTNYFPLFWPFPSPCENRCINSEFLQQKFIHKNGTHLNQIHKKGLGRTEIWMYGCNQGVKCEKRRHRKATVAVTMMKVLLVCGEQGQLPCIPYHMGRCHRHQRLSHPKCQQYPVEKHWTWWEDKNESEKELRDLPRSPRSKTRMSLAGGHEQRLGRLGGSP